jgi:hypothetical protein
MHESVSASDGWGKCISLLQETQSQLKIMSAEMDVALAESRIALEKITAFKDIMGELRDTTLL